MQNFKIEGLVAPPFTPFSDNRELNLDVIPKYVDHLVQECNQGVWVAGTSGEGLLLTVEERIKLAECWVDAGKDKLKYVIIQVGAESIKDTQKLASHAQAIGAHSIAVLPPTFYQPETTVCLEEIFSAAQNKVPTLVGAKFVSNDLSDMGRSLTLFNGKYQVMFGQDGMILGAFAMGAVSSVGVSFNLAGKTANAVVNALIKGDLETARENQNRLQALMHVISDHGGKSRFPMAAFKAAMKLKGINVGPPRFPLIALNQKEVEQLKCDLQNIGFFDWA